MVKGERKGQEEIGLYIKYIYIYMYSELTCKLV